MMIDMDRLEQIGLGHLHLTLDQLYEFTPRELQNLQKGMEETLERTYREEWERARWQASAVVNIWSKKFIKPEKLLSFPWEKKKRIKRSTLSQNEALQAIRNHEKLGVI